ncbi:hypothetical protein ACFT38_18950 [Streptomyces sp. NPDC056975]|uniref:hypothetical protein n=1 Tax=Streptomyces sp. NPDC056975 TaxID=3345985 RepID=UPI003628AB3B
MTAGNSARADSAFWKSSGECPAISSNSSSVGESWPSWMPLTTSRVSSRRWAEVKGPRFDAAVLEPVPAEVDLRGGRYLALPRAQDLQLVLLPGLAEPELVRGVGQLGLVAQAPLLVPVRDRLVVQAQPQDAGTARPIRSAAAGLQWLLPAPPGPRARRVGCPRSRSRG